MRDNTTQPTVRNVPRWLASARLCALICALLVINPLLAQTRQLPVDRIDISETEELTPEQVTQRIRELAQTARNYQAACERFEAEFDGSPAFASKVALLKLKMLENAALAITVSAGEIENARCTTRMQQCRNQADRVQIDSQIKELDTELTDLADGVDLSGDRLQGDEAAMVLMAKKLERLGALQEDTETLRDSQNAINKTLENLDSLDKSIHTYSLLMQEEVKSQADAMTSNRIARQSAVLSKQAEQLYAAVQKIRPVIGSMNKPTPRAVTPSVIAPDLPVGVQPSLTPEMEHRLREYIQARRSAAKPQKRPAAQSTAGLR